MIEELEEKIKTEPTLTAHEVEDFFKIEFGVHVNEIIIYRVMKKVKENIEGSEKEQYARLWDYLAEL